MPNDIEIKVKVLPTQSATQNVMFLFDGKRYKSRNAFIRKSFICLSFFLSCTDSDNDDGKRILYTGQFTEYRSVQENSQFIQSAELEIDHLYIDKTLSEMDPLHDENSIRKTCAAVSDLIEYGFGNLQGSTETITN